MKEPKQVDFPLPLIELKYPVPAGCFRQFWKINRDSGFMVPVPYLQPGVAPAEGDELFFMDIRFPTDLEDDVLCWMKEFCEVAKVEAPKLDLEQRPDGYFRSQVTQDFWRGYYMARIQFSKQDEKERQESLALVESQMEEYDVYLIQDSQMRKHLVVNAASHRQAAASGSVTAFEVFRVRAVLARVSKAGDRYFQYYKNVAGMEGIGTFDDWKPSAEAEWPDPVGRWKW